VTQGPAPHGQSEKTHSASRLRSRIRRTTHSGSQRCCQLSRSTAGNLAIASANLVKRSTHWYGRLSSGSAPDDFARALEGVVSLLTKHESFLTEFRRGNGDAELVLNHGVELMEGKCFGLHLGHVFLGQLAATGIGLRIQGWNTFG